MPKRFHFPQFAVFFWTERLHYGSDNAGPASENAGPGAKMKVPKTKMQAPMGKMQEMRILCLNFF